MSRNADSACPFCIDSNTKKGMLTQQFVTHVAVPIRPPLMECLFPVTCRLKNGQGRAVIIIIPLFFIIPIKYHYCHGNTTTCFIKSFSKFKTYQIRKVIVNMTMKRPNMYKNRHFFRWGRLIRTVPFPGRLHTVEGSS